MSLLRDETMALLRDVTEEKIDRLWAEAMNDACDMSKQCATASVDQGATPCEVSYDRAPSYEGLLPVGTVGYMRNLTTAHKIALRGLKCILLDTSPNYPCKTFRVRV